ncbi:transposase [Muricoccus aerilatus]|uniref:transposase n=1 Tax=Muricoccus aerilatus TaxID=452982 RepID=UPI000A0085CE|nr:transposase [Roseomonas aerilata]
MPFKANADHRYRIPRQRQSVTDWAEYDAGLRARGNLAVWFTAEAIEGWRAEARSGRGRQAKYPNLAIATALTLCAVFRLAMRAARKLHAGGRGPHGHHEGRQTPSECAEPPPLTPTQPL